MHYLQYNALTIILQVLTYNNTSAILTLQNNMITFKIAIPIYTLLTK